MTEKNSMMKLNNENYEIWRVLMEAVLTRKGLHEVALGITPRPATGPNSPAGKAWEKKNIEARAEMILSVDVEQLAHMRGADAIDVWTELESVHRAQGFATKMSLRRKFISSRMRSDQKMSAWIGEVRTIAYQLTQVGVTLTDEDTILVLTTGLPSSYTSFIVALDATDPTLLTLEYVIGRLLNEESRHLSQKPRFPPKPDTNEAYYAAAASDAPHPLSPTRRPLSMITCFGCQQKGHYQRDCPSASTPSTSNSVAVTAAAILESDDEADGVF
jgi:hypothetical protein